MGVEGRGTMAAILIAMKGDCQCQVCEIMRKVGESMIKEFEA